MICLYVFIHFPSDLGGGTVHTSVGEWLSVKKDRYLSVAPCTVVDARAHLACQLENRRLLEWEAVACGGLRADPRFITVSRGGYPG